MTVIMFFQQEKLAKRNINKAAEKEKPKEKENETNAEDSEKHTNLRGTKRLVDSVIASPSKRKRVARKNVAKSNESILNVIDEDELHKIATKEVLL